MEVKILEKCYVGTGGNLHKGATVDLDDRIALLLNFFVFFC